MQIASAINLVVHIERMRDGIRRVQSIVEIAGMEGEIITARDLFTFQYRGERRDGLIDGTFEPTRLRPDFIARAARFGLDRELLDALGIGGALNCSIQSSCAALASTDSARRRGFLAAARRARPRRHRAAPQGACDGGGPSG